MGQLLFVSEVKPHYKTYDATVIRSFFQCFLIEIDEAVLPVNYIKVVNRCMEALSWWSPSQLVTVCVQEVRVNTGNSRMWLVSFTVPYFLFLIVAVGKALWTGSSHPSTPACRHENEPPASANQSLRCCGPVRGPSTPPDARRGTMNTGPSPKKLLLSVSILKRSGEEKSMLTHMPSQSSSTIITCQYWSLCTHRALWRQCFRQNNSCS